MARPPPAPATARRSSASSSRHGAPRAAAACPFLVAPAELEARELRPAIAARELHPPWPRSSSARHGRAGARGGEAPARHGHARSSRRDHAGEQQPPPPVAPIPPLLPSSTLPMAALAHTPSMRPSGTEDGKRRRNPSPLHTGALVVAVGARVGVRGGAPHSAAAAPLCSPCPSPPSPSSCPRRRGRRACTSPGRRTEVQEKERQKESLGG